MKKQEFIEMMKQVQAPLFKMVEMVPENKLDWAPAPGFMTLGQLLQHLSDNWSAIRMLVTNEWPYTDPEKMEESMKLENMPSLSKEEALKSLKKDIDEGVAYVQNEISEEDFFSATVSAPWGFTGQIWQGVIMMRDHQMNHKMQLHLYLKLLNQPVHTGTLYGM